MSATEEKNMAVETPKTEKPAKRKRRRLLPPMFSPAGMAARAVGLVVLYIILTLCGLRESTSFLSGTTPDGGALDMPAMLAGLGYLLSWFSVLLATPILLIAAGLWWGAERLMPNRVQDTKQNSKP